MLPTNTDTFNSFFPIETPFISFFHSFIKKKKKKESEKIGLVLLASKMSIFLPGGTHPELSGLTVAQLICFYK